MNIYMQNKLPSDNNHSWNAKNAAIKQNSLHFINPYKQHAMLKLYQTFVLWRHQEAVTWPRSTTEILKTHVSSFEICAHSLIFNFVIRMSFITGRCCKTFTLNNSSCQFPPLAFFKDDRNALTTTNACWAGRIFAPPTPGKQKMKSQLLSVKTNNIQL